MTLRRSKEICRASRQDSALTCCFGSGFGCPRLPMDSVQPGEAAKNAWDRLNEETVHISWSSVRNAAFPISSMVLVYMLTLGVPSGYLT